MSKSRLGIMLFVCYGLITYCSGYAYAANLVSALDQVNLNLPPPSTQHKTYTAHGSQIHIPQVSAQSKEPEYHDNSKRAVHVTLPDSIGIALRKNPDIDKAYLARITDRFSLEVAEGEFEIQPKLAADYKSHLHTPFGSQQATSVTPELSLKTPFGTQFDFTWDNAFGKRFQSSTKMLSITQPILQGLGTDVNEIKLKNAYDQEILNKLTLKQQIITTVSQVITDFHALQQAEMGFVNDKESLKISEQTVINTRKQIKAGTVARSDIYQYLSPVASDKLQIQTDLNTLQQAKITFSNDLGIDPNTDLVVSTTVHTPHVVPNLTLSRKLALENDQTYLTAVISIRKDKRAMLQARDSALWNLSMTASVSRESFGRNQGPQPNVDTSANDSVGLKLSVPLGLEHLKNEEGIASAKITYQEDLIALRDDKRKLLNKVQQEIESINIDLKKLTIANQAVELQQRALDTTTKKLRVGLASGLELTTAQKALRDSKQSLIGADIGYLNDLSTFDQTVGTTLNTWNIKVHY